MVSGTDEHGTPITVAADAEGITPREIADRNNRIIVNDLPVARAQLRPLHPDDDGQPRRRQPGDLPGPAEERLRLPEDDARRDQPVDRPHAARPLHRGHLPDLRLRRRPRRPVRQLRQPARPDRPDQPGQQDQRRDAEVRRGGALLPRPAGVRPGARRLAGHPQELAAQRPQLQRQPARRPQAAQLHPRHRLGRPGAARRLARPATTSGSTCGSTPSSATCRRRSSGPAAPATPRPGGSGGRRRTPTPTTSWARTTSSSTPRSGPPSCSATTARATRAAPRARSAGSTCPPRWSPASSSRWRGASSPRRVRSSSTCATSSPGTTPTRCATSSPSPARRTRTPTSPGRSSCAATTTSSSPAGATWSTARCRWRPRTSAPSRRRAS